ncbi:hypothetical protein M3Y96_01071400 [Aphelenchoides besseyi]|nr:hypothetical protein M3Y96_01071400 [Aphelenchoides besseyi]
MSSIAQLPERRLLSLPNIGVGGLVEDANLRILLMKERSDLYLDCNFPGDCCSRVLEEMGIEMIFDGVLMFRHSKTTPFHKDTCDLYCVCYLKPDDKFKFETTPYSSEAAVVSELPSGEIRKFHHTILEPLMQ